MVGREVRIQDPSRRAVMRGAAVLAGGVMLGGSGQVLAAPGALAAEEPRVHTRSEWEARKPTQTPGVLDGQPDHIVVHHTATENGSDTSRERAFSLSRGIQNWHMDNNGWIDAGQHLTISRGGHVMEGRWGSLPNIRDKRHVVGAHTADHNSHTIGIENEGSYGSTEPPALLMGALTETLAWLCTVYGLDPQKAIVGHRDYNSTECPGDKLYARLDELRGAVRERQSQMAARLELMDYAEVPQEFRPSYPPLPRNERVEQYYHGPVLGDGERDAG